MRLSLLKMEAKIGVRVQWSCAPESGEQAVQLVLRAAPEEGQERMALGAARTERGRILPYLELYYDSLRWMLPSRLAAVEGRAMARVVAHELLHYLRQSGAHEGSELLHADLTTARLMAP